MANKKNKPTIRKLVASGPMIELLSYPEPPRRLLSHKFTQEELVERKRIKELYNSGTEIPVPEKTNPSVSRSRSKLRRLINANSWIWKDKNGYLIPPKFLTLTIWENIQDLKTANYTLTKFIQRFNYRFKDVLVEPLKYVCVPEFQERGAVHYHIVLFNFPFMDLVFKKIRDLWEDRFELKTIRRDADTSIIISYVSKYITKQSNDGRFWGQKRYFTSRGLVKPIVLYDDIAIELIRQRIWDLEKFRKDIMVDFVGNINYKTFYLGDKLNIYSLPLDDYVLEKLKSSK